MSSTSTSKKQRVAVVTGAGSGIGRAAAILLAREGYAVALVGQTEAKLRSTQTQIADKPSLVIAADLSQSSQCDRVVRETASRFGQLDALCNIAGIAAVASIEQTDDALWRRTMGANLDGPFYLTRAAWRSLKTCRGVVVNVSSVASFDPFPGFAAYAPSKAGLNMLTRVTADEGAPFGVRAVTIAPGAVETPMLRAYFDEKTIPNDATLSPETVASLIVDCVTGRRAFTPGEVIPIRPGPND